MENRNFCRDCKYVVETFGVSAWGVTTAYRCDRLRDLVSGEPKLCDMERGILGECGKIGRFFEPREEEK